MVVRLWLTGVALLLAVGVARGADRFDVKAFGAAGDGMADDAPAFRRALEAALKSGSSATIAVPKGRYRFASAQEARSPAGAKVSYRGTAHLVVMNAQGLTIEGEPGSVLVMGDGAEEGLVIAGSSGVNLRNLAIDYLPLPFTQGRVIKVDRIGGSFDLEVVRPYGNPAADPYRAKGAIWRALFFEGESRRFDFQVPHFEIAGAQAIRPGVWRLRTASRAKAFAYLKEGSLAAVIARYNGKYAVRFVSSSDSMVDGVTVHSSPGGAFNLSSSEGIVFRNCLVAPPAASDRLVSTNADGLHVKHNRRGPLVESCSFSRQGDDSINIGTSLAPVLVQPDAHTVVADLPRNTRVGDSLRFIDGATGEEFAEGRVAQADVIAWRDGNAMKLRLQSPVPVRATATSLGLDAMDKRPPVKRAASERRLPTLVVNADLGSPGTTIRKSRFGDHHGRAILIRGRGATIEDNTFRHLLGPAIIGGFELNFSEGPSVEDLTIRRNVFEDIALTNILVANTGIGDYPLLPSGFGNRRVAIVENAFSGFGSAAWRDPPRFAQVITLGSMDGAEIRGNRIGAAARGLDRGWIGLHHVREVVVDQPGMTTRAGRLDFGSEQDRRATRVAK